MPAKKTAEESMFQIANFPEYFENKRIRSSATYRCYPNGKFVYILKGDIEICPQKFEAMFPIDLLRVPNEKGDSPDKRRNWINNQNR